MNRGKTYAELNETRRSWVNFTGEVVSRETLEKIVGEAALAPSGSNLQPTRLVIAQGEALEKFMPGLLGSNPKKVRSAGTMVIVFGDPNAVEENDGSREFYDSTRTSRHDFAARNASLAAMNFMLAAWSYGVATRPMIGFEPYVIRDKAEVPRHWIPVMLMAAGYPDKDNPPGPRSRKPIERFLTFL